jgi:hypothetical protein
MRELQRFRQFLAEGNNSDAQLDALKDKVSGKWASTVLFDGGFGTVSPFGSGYDESPLINVTKEIEKELEFYSKEPYTDDLDIAKDDLEAAKEIAQAVKELGGRVAYGSDGLQFVYTVNDQGDLMGQAIATDEEIKPFKGTSPKKWTPKGFAFIFRTNDLGKENFEKAKSVLQNQGIPFEEDSEMNGQIALNFSGTQNTRDLIDTLVDNGVGRFTTGNVGQYK